MDTSMGKEVFRTDPGFGIGTDFRPIPNIRPEFDLRNLLESPIPFPEFAPGKWNNSIRLESYPPFACYLRRKAEDGDSSRDYFSRFLDRPFPTSGRFRARIPIARPVTGMGANRSVLFIGEFTDSTLVAFRGEQILKLRKSPGTTRIESGNWYKSTHDSILPAGSLDIDLLSYSMRGFDIGPQVWPSRFIYGFPTVGSISREFVFHPNPKPAPCSGDIESISDSVTERFRHRTRPKPRAKETLWAEALEQVSRGWLGQPELLDSRGRLIESPGKKINPVFRFAVFQLDKVRAIDDLKHGLVNKL